MIQPSLILCIMYFCLSLMFRVSVGWAFGLSVGPLVGRLVCHNCLKGQEVIQITIIFTFHDYLGWRRPFVERRHLDSKIVLKLKWYHMTNQDSPNILLYTLLRLPCIRPSIQPSVVRWLDSWAHITSWGMSKDLVIREQAAERPPPPVHEERQRGHLRGVFLSYYS